MERQVEIITTTTATMNDTIYSLELKLNEQIAYSELLESFVIKCVRVYSWAGDDIDGGDIQDWAEEIGVIKQVEFDTKKHTDNSGLGLEDGDTYYELSKQSPSQSLNKLKADAVKSFAVALSYHEDFIHLRDCIEEFQREYANQLLKEGA